MRRDRNGDKTMKTFKNKNFTKRDYECTNIVACCAEKAPDGEIWVECEEKDLPKNLTKLWIEKGVQYLGWL
jgi:hypothetical protein